MMTARVFSVMEGQLERLINQGIRAIMLIYAGRCQLSLGKKLPPASPLLPIRQLCHCKFSQNPDP
jgi:hypothetical protein